MSVTGAYAGVGIQYVAPALLCFYGRRAVGQFANLADNPHRFDLYYIEARILFSCHILCSRSIFKNTYWIIVTCVWAFISIVLVTLYLALVYFPDLNSSSSSTNPSCNS